MGFSFLDILCQGISLRANTACCCHLRCNMMVIGSRVVVLGINPDRKGRDAFGITQRMPASMEAFFSSEVTVATACGLAVLLHWSFLPWSCWLPSASLTVSSCWNCSAHSENNLRRTSRCEKTAPARTVSSDVRWPSALAALFVWPKYFSPYNMPS